MTTKRQATKNAPPPKRNPDTIQVAKSSDTPSQSLAKLATDSRLSAVTLKKYSGIGENDMLVTDLMDAMKKAGDEVVAGDMGRIERMLTSQALTLDAIFNNMARGSIDQTSFKGIEVMLRLALKAQAQARSTAEALALLKNPMPYIKQANMTTGPQQVNNYASGSQGKPSHAENSQTEQNKLLEADHGERLDIGATTQAGRGDQTMEAVGAVHRAGDA